MVYSINYDLRKPGQDYSGLYDAIKKLGAWWHYMDSYWLVDTTLNAQQINERIKPHIDANDYVLVIGVTSDYAGWLPKDAWDWLRERVRRAA